MPGFVANRAVGQTPSSTVPPFALTPAQERPNRLRSPCLSADDVAELERVFQARLRDSVHAPAISNDCVSLQDLHLW